MRLLATLLLLNLTMTAAAAIPQASVNLYLNHSTVQPGQQVAAAVVLDIPAGFHAQSHTPSNENFIPLEVKVETTGGFTPLPPIYPPGTEENYPALGQLNVYSGQLVIYVPLTVNKNAAGNAELRGTIRYQLCDDQVCYPPEKKSFATSIPVVAAGQTVSPANTEFFVDFNPAAFAASAQPPALMIFGAAVTDDAYLLAFFAAFVVGIIFNIMPCVLPVVPLKAIGFYEVSQHNRAKSLALGAVFSAGLVGVFAILGLLVVVLRRLAWGELFSNPYVLAAIVAVLAIFAFSQFGLFGVRLPTSVYRFTPRHDTYLGNFLFGILTAVLSTPCTFGLFLGLLIWATRQPGTLGLLLVITVGIGMAFPYLLLSAAPGLARRFPRTGPWSALVKQMMGFLLLASAVYFARRFIEAGIGASAYWWLLFAVVAAAGIFLVVRALQFSRTWIGPAVAVSIATLFVLPALVVTWRLTNPPIAWQAYSPEALTQARATGRPVMVEFTAAWCGNCLALEATVLHNPQVVAAIEQHRVIPLRADVTEENAPGWDLLRQLNPVAAIPLTAIYLPDRAEPIQLRGLFSTGDLLAALSAD